MEEIFNTEIGRKILALTKASFRVSDLISDLVFREKIKHQTLAVFEKFVAKNYRELLKEIDTLNHYFYLGGHLNLVKEEHLKQLRNGFLVLKSHIILSMNESSKSDTHSLISPLASENVGGSVSNLSAKQKKILEKFEDKNTLKLSEIMEVLQNLSEKTVRNELSDLINLGKITRSGIGNGSFYKLVR